MKWHPCAKLPPLAFDHAAIIYHARSFLKDNLSPLLLSHLIPKTFPLNALQEAHEIIEGRAFDNRNFRKQMVMGEVVEETKEMERNVSHRPAKLYRFTRSAMRQ